MFNDLINEHEAIARVMLNRDSPRRVYLALQTGDYRAKELSKKFDLPLDSVNKSIVLLISLGLVKIKGGEFTPQGAKQRIYTACVKKIQFTFDNGQMKLEIPT